MGAFTATVDADGYSPQDASNAGYAVRCKLTGSASYATGGDTIAGSTIGLGSITKLVITGGGDAAAGAGTASYQAIPVYDTSLVNVTKVQVFWTGAGFSGAFAEITATTNLSTIVFDAIAYGT